MLVEKLVPKEFWPEVVNWAVHLLNRCPTLVVKDKTPEEAWCGFKPSVNHFKVFGCIGHVHIPDIKRQKLDDKSLQFVFLGLSEGSKAYRMYDPVSKKVIVSRDMVFEEDKKWEWDKLVEEANNMVLTWGDVEKQQGNEKGSVRAEEEQNEDDANDSGLTLSEEADYNGYGSMSIEATAHSPPSPIQGRERKAPFWMEDYVSGEGLSEAEETNLIMFTAPNDPMFFEEAAKSSRWREAMELKIKAIEKNGTRKLITLPVGAKKIGVKWIFKTKLRMVKLTNTKRGL